MYNTGRTGLCDFDILLFANWSTNVKNTSISVPLRRSLTWSSGVPREAESVSVHRRVALEPQVDVVLRGADGAAAR